MEHDFFDMVKAEEQRLEALGLTPTAISMSYAFFESALVQDSFINREWEVEYAKAKLHPADPLSIYGLPVCFNYGNCGDKLDWGLAVKAAEGS